jgi:hypothetical protein
MRASVLSEQVPLEARLATSRNERESERLRLEKLSVRLRQKMEAAAQRGKEQATEAVNPES